MKENKIDRRTFIRGVGATGLAVGTLGFPAIIQSATKMSEVEIGFVYPFSGPSASPGNNALRGWEIAVDEINSEGGIKSLGGARIKTVLGDTQTNPRVGLSEMEKVAGNKKIPIVVGCFNSSVTYPATQLSEQYGLPHIIPIATQTEIMKRGFKYVFRMSMNSERMAQRMVDFVEEMGKKTGHVAKKAGLMSLDENYGKTTATEVKEALKKTNQQVVEDIYYPMKVTNVDVEIAKLKAAKPDVIYFTSYVLDAVLITKTLAAQKVNVLGYVTNGSGFFDPRYIQMVGNLGNYFYGMAKFDHDLNRPVEVEFQNKMMKKYGVPANDFSAILFGTVYLIKDVLERAGTIDRDKVRDAIAATNITSGNALIMPAQYIRFDATGENPGARDLMAQCLDERWHTVWPLDWKRKHDPVWPMPKWEERKV